MGIFLKDSEIKVVLELMVYRGISNLEEEESELYDNLKDYLKKTEDGRKWIKWFLEPHE